MSKTIPKNVFKGTSKSNSISFIISSHLSQFRRIHKIFPTNLSLEKLLTPPNTKPPRKKSFSLRPPNGFILYRKDVQQEIIKNNSDVTFKTVSAIASKKWKCESEEKKNFFNSLSRVAHLVYLDICEIHVDQNNEHLNFDLQVENNKQDKKNLERPWMQSSIFPTMLVSPNSLQCENNVEKNNNLQNINDDKLNQSFYYNDFIKTPSVPSSYNNILDTDQPIFPSSIPSSSYLSSNVVESENYYFPYISDFILNSNNSNNNNTYQIPSHECKTMHFDYNQNNDYSYFSGTNDETF